MDALTATQQQALTQLQTLTNGESDVAMSVLQSVDWDVQACLSSPRALVCLPLRQKAAELIFDTPPMAGPSMSPRSPSPHRRMENLELDDSRQGDGQASRSRRRRVG